MMGCARAEVKLTQHGETVQYARIPPLSRPSDHSTRLVNAMFRTLNDRSSILIIAIVLSDLSRFQCIQALADDRRTLIRNAALILTMDAAVGTGELGILENADLVFEGDKIKEVGRNLNGVGAQVVDATGKIVLPGFVDA